jgi:hypothetical protein
MNTKRIYIVLCMLGFAVPYYFLGRFVAENGLHFSVIVGQIVANPLLAFFATDVIVTSLVLWVFMYRKTRKGSIKLWWVCIIANLAVGVSLALPLFLLLREIQREKHPQ